MKLKYLTPNLTILGLTLSCSNAGTGRVAKKMDDKDCINNGNPKPTKTKCDWLDHLVCSTDYRWVCWNGLDSYEGPAT